MNWKDEIRNLIENWHYQAGDDVLASTLADLTIEITQKTLLVQAQNVRKIIHSNAYENTDMCANVLGDIEDKLDSIIRKAQ